MLDGRAREQRPKTGNIAATEMNIPLPINQAGGFVGGNPTSQYGVTVNKLHNFTGDFMDSAMMAAGTDVYASGKYTRNQGSVFLEKLANMAYGNPNEDFDVKTKPNIQILMC